MVAGVKGKHQELCDRPVQTYQSAGDVKFCVFRAEVLVRHTEHGSKDETQEDDRFFEMTPQDYFAIKDSYKVNPFGESLMTEKMRQVATESRAH